VRDDNSWLETEVVKRKRESETRALSNIGCQYNWCISDLGAAESCYCRPDLQVVATKYLTKCLWFKLSLVTAVP
jgi:hypothetical protein